MGFRLISVRLVCESRVTGRSAFVGCDSLHVIVLVQRIQGFQSVDAGCAVSAGYRCEGGCLSRILVIEVRVIHRPRIGFECAADALAPGVSIVAVATVANAWHVGSPQGFLWRYRL